MAMKFGSEGHESLDQSALPETEIGRAELSGAATDDEVIREFDPDGLARCLDPPGHLMVG